MQKLHTTRLVSIQSGSDWADASYQLLWVREGVNLEESYRSYVETHLEPRREVIANMKRGSPLPEYIPFDEWLVKKELAERAEAETYYDYA